jgi:putative hydrolase of HD superfamily
MEFENVLNFLKEADLLKNVDRQTLIHNGGRRENSAEHSWHLALAAMAFQKMAPPGLDLSKALQMALLHDIVEIDAGDTIVYAEQPDKNKTEALALNRITGLLPANLRENFKTIWNEFEAGESIEAQYISAIDRFLPIYSNYLNAGHSWVNHHVSAARVIARCEAPITKGIPELWPATLRMLEESIQRGHLQRH